MKVAYIIVSRKENSVSRGQLVVREEFKVPNTALYSSSVTQKVLRWYEIAHMPKKIEACTAARRFSTAPKRRHTQNHREALIKTRSRASRHRDSELAVKAKRCGRNGLPDFDS
ncbi:hypothetical protein PCANC_05675 [Puccinia coronata f. sp. avenae]|uniref:Uncharacterized protein n=1 Tax=Puccinia coronata f. sp. avenae TaxID=200324 RepID=A0A2N5T3Y5_9BASI|nr:hypothetical protein PCANC_09853 [Puccinia coronata f. sp. avenae]PLW54812.1 hypothetical protein PCANC_05675 [Puccinia coronata f. sp. avenae]